MSDPAVNNGRFKTDTGFPASGQIKTFHFEAQSAEGGLVCSLQSVSQSAIQNRGWMPINERKVITSGMEITTR